MKFSNEIKMINYEEPLPIIKLSTLEINLSLTPHTIYTGALTITNQGGGELRGQIFCPDPYIQCNTTTWEQNKQVCIYRVDTMGMEIGKTYKTSFTILSNGGEVFLPILITIEALEERAEDRFIGWTSIEEFAQLAKTDWEESVTKFNSEEFLNWLHQVQHQSFISLYQYVKKSFSPETAIEAFLVGSGVKKPSQLALAASKTNIRLIPGQTKDVDYVVEVQQEEWGFVQAKVYTTVDWIQLWKESLTNKDFDQQGRAYIPFRIIPTTVGKKYETGVLIIETQYQTLVYEVNVVKRKELEYRLSQKSFEKEDKGELIITNYTGEDLMIHIRPSVSWVRFEAKKYLIAKQARIPFSVRFTSWDKWMSQMFSSNRLFQQVTITVQTQIHKKRVQEIIPLIVGTQTDPLHSVIKLEDQESDV
ncbi:MAG: hypothetical protein GX962_07860 [Epulopiscium sp.]|nr:hypothetical protein [Candidatus Epulonipiscium sp.]